MAVYCGRWGSAAVAGLVGPVDAVAVAGAGPDGSAERCVGVSNPVCYFVRCCASGVCV